MASIKPSSRYTTTNSAASSASSFHSASPRSSTKSNPSSSTDHLYPTKLSSSSRALVKTNNKPASTANNFSSMVKKFMETKSNSSSSSALRKVKKGGTGDAVRLVVAADFLAEDLKRPVTGAKRATPLSALHKKLFKGSKKEEDKSERKALTEVKGNTRTLAMVLRSERELLSMNKEQETQIAKLKLLLEEKNTEVDKLKDLCLKQREEIKSLKSAILFPDVMNSQLQELLEKQGSELKQAKQLIPSLQRQVTSLTGQLQGLAVDLEEVKADKYSVRGCHDMYSSPRTPPYDQDEEFSSGNQTTPGSPNDLFLEDLNPCLTPYYSKTKSEEYDSTDDEGSFGNNLQTRNDVSFNSFGRKLSKSSDCCRCSKTSNSSVRATHKSDESKCTHGKQMHHKLF